MLEFMLTTCNYLPAVGGVVLFVLSIVLFIASVHIRRDAFYKQAQGTFWLEEARRDMDESKKMRDDANRVLERTAETQAEVRAMLDQVKTLHGVD